MKRFSNILLIADEDIDWGTALQRAITLAKNNHATLTVCAVVDDVPAEVKIAAGFIAPQELRDIAVSEKRAELEVLVKSITHEGITVESKVLVGKPFIEIIQQVLREKFDLAIKCAEQRANLREAFLGSTDMHLLRKCPCPVWIIKSAEHLQYRRILAAIDLDPADAAKETINRQILDM